MNQTAEFLFAIGTLLLLALMVDHVGRRTFLPRVTLLLTLGILMGDDVLGLIPDSLNQRFELITNIALLMIGFLLGGKLTAKSLRQSGRQLGWISISASVGTALVVSLTLTVLSIPFDIALLLGCVAAATAPAATVDTVLESEIDNRFSRLLLAIVAMDDVWALILFSLVLAMIAGPDGHGIGSSLLGASYDIGVAVLIGVAIGLPAAYLTGRIKSGQPMLTEALGLVFLCGGAALWFEVSFLIAAMTMGAVITNMARHHEYPFHEIENIEQPFMAIFFILAGASLEFDMLQEIGVIGAIYLLARVAGKLSGAWFGALISQAEPAVRNWMGLALMPQAGVAIGMALLIASSFPEYRQIILSIVISTTVIFEIVGPVATRFALKKSLDDITPR